MDRSYYSSLLVRMQIPSRESRGERNDVGCGGNAALSKYAYVYETKWSVGVSLRG